MQVYKCFLRILNRQKGQVFMYLGIFIFLSILMSGQGKDSAETAFEASSCTFAVFDEDGSEVSRGMTEYLSQHNEKKEIRDDAEAIQDAIYNRNIMCVIRIPAGFGEAMKKGTAEGMLEITTVPGTVYGEIFEGEVNGYAMVLDCYLAGEFSEKEAVEKAKSALAQEVEVKLADAGNDGTNSALYYNFQYVPYIYLAICIVAIGPILIVFQRKDVKDRIHSSPYPVNKVNLGLFAGMVTTGLGLAVVHFGILLVSRADVFSFRGGLFLLNELCFLIVPLGITFLIGQLVSNLNVLSMIANVVGLGMSFLGGVFVPLRMMSDGIVTVAHVLPSYWYVRACEWIDTCNRGDSLRPLMGFFGMQLLFGLVFIGAGMGYSFRRRRNG